MDVLGSFNCLKLRYMEYGPPQLCSWRNVIKGPKQPIDETYGQRLVETLFFQARVFLNFFFRFLHYYCDAFVARVRSCKECTYIDSSSTRLLS